MIAYVLLGFGLLVGFLLLAKWFTVTEPAKVAKLVKITAAVLAGVFALFLVVAGRLGSALVVLAAIGPLFLRWRALMRRMRSAGGPAPGARSTVRTAMLEMILDHDSGAMTGTVLAGRFRGRALDDLGLEALLALRGECAADDPQSVAVLEAYLDRAHGADWREAAEAQAGAGAGAGAAGGAGRGAASAVPPGTMSREEAYEILGLEPDADAAAIKAAHHRLMMKLHPDQGGSTYLAVKINQAKEVLLGG